MKQIGPLKLDVEAHRRHPITLHEFGSIHHHRSGIAGANDDTKREGNTVHGEKEKLSCLL